MKSKKKRTSGRQIVAVRERAVIPIQSCALSLRMSRCLIGCRCYGRSKARFHTPAARPRDITKKASSSSEYFAT